MSTLFLRSLLICMMGCSLGATVSANVIIGGLEDLPGGGREGNGDYNDMMFRISGSVQVVSPGASFQNLTSGLVTGQGATFWDGLSSEAWNANVGFCLLGNGACNLADRPTGDLQYLAADASAFALDVAFEAHDLVTFTMIGERAGLADWNTLGWYDPEHPDQIHSIFAGLATTGASYSFNPGGRFVLISTNGIGQTYSSIAAQNRGEKSTYQHFAFFQADAPVSVQNLESVSTPEPGTFLTGGFGLAMLAAWKATRRRTRESRG